MSELEDVKTMNGLLNALNINEEQLIAIKENRLADANFILTNLMVQFFSQKNDKICLVIMHNTVGHYHNVLKRLGFDFLKKIQEGFATTIEPLKKISESIIEGDENDGINFLSEDKEAIVRGLFLEINNKIQELLKDENEARVYLIIDDVSHLLDLGIDVKLVITFLNYCTNLASNNRVSLVINCHVANETDELISNALGYVADVNIEVSPLKTGVSHDVTGVITITKAGENMGLLTKEKVLHYKALEKEIKVFSPGGALLYLRK